MIALNTALGLVLAFVLGLAIWLPAAWVLGRRLSWSVPAILAIAFAAAPVTTGIAGMIAWVSGSGLLLAAGLVVGQALGLALLAWRWRGTEERVRFGLQGVILGALAGGLALYERPWFAFTSDTFYHLAAARSLLATNAPLVTDPFHGTATTSLDPTSGVFHTWLAVASRLSTIQVEYIFAGFAAVAAATLVWAFWALAERISGSQTAATIGTFGFVALGLWGDLRPMGLPNRFTVAYLCIALLAIYEIAASDHRRSAAALAAVATASALLTHIAAAGALMLFAAAVIVVALLFHRRLSERGFLGTALIALLASAVIALPVMWPRVSAILGSPMTDTSVELPDAFISLGAGLVMVTPGAYVGGGALVFALMTLIAGVATYRGYRDRDGATLTAAAFLAVPAVFLCFPPVTTLATTLSAYTVARVALMLKFVPFLAAAWAIGAGLNPAEKSAPAMAGPDGFASAEKDAPAPARSRLTRWILPAAGATILVAHTLASWQLTQVTYVEVPGRMRNGEAYTVEQSNAADIRNSWGLAALKDAREVFSDDYPVVAASPETGYYLAGLANVAIVAAPDSHSPLAIDAVDGPERREDMARLLDPATTETGRRMLLQKWDASFVALSLSTDQDILAWESMRTQTYLFEPVVESRRLVILRVLD